MSFANDIWVQCYNIWVQVSGAVGANLYQANDAPNYLKANSAIIGIILFNLIIVYPGTALYYKWRNASKAKKWDAMTVDQQSHCAPRPLSLSMGPRLTSSLDLATTTDEGAKRLDFRFIY